ncbi:MAG: hypothetical protein ACRDDY_13680 [Clostridium sp.]|uniref:hypothetical protein n=1 Tax=Clostridium sp. TaxID=1506 RepID=UPI003EE4BF14
MDIDRNKKLSTVIHTHTVNAKKLFKPSQNKRYIVVRGERDLRIELIRAEVLRLMLKWKPEVIVAEAPFLNRRQVTAFEALVEVRTMIRSVVWDYDPNIKVVFVDPIRVKNYIGVSHVNTTKDDMHDAVHAFYDGKQKNEALAEADEHSIDATAVCHFYFRSAILGDVIESTKKKRGKNASKRVTRRRSRKVLSRSTGGKVSTGNSGDPAGTGATANNNRARAKRVVKGGGAAPTGSVPQSLAG